MALLLLSILMIALAALAPRFGADSRELDRNADRPNWLGTPDSRTSLR